MQFFDTIVAPITGSQKAAVAVVRVSGPLSFSVGSAVFEGWREPVPFRLAVYGRFAHGDDGLCVAFEEGHSYTGEATVEFSVHGSPASVQGFVAKCIEAGARLAEPGEFTQRAFLNGRIDLAQAEAVREVIDAKTELQFRATHRNLEGALSQRVVSIRDRLTTLLVAVEASTDFSEEIGDFDEASGLENLRRVAQEIENLRQLYEKTRPLREGIVIAIAGAPNVGKSSLFNAVLGYDRAIVTPIPGTTRDVVGAAFELDGIPCQLMDTAGLRQTEDVVERKGIELSEEQLRTADLVWYVSDASLGLSSEDRETLSQIKVPHVLVANKSDLHTSSEGVPVSAKTGDGLNQLLNETREVLGEVWADDVMVNPRHQPLLANAQTAVEQAIQTLETQQPADLLSVCLRSAIHELGLIIGEQVTPDILERIFHDFCIGK